MRIIWSCYIIIVYSVLIRFFYCRLISISDAFYLFHKPRRIWYRKFVIQKKYCSHHGLLKNLAILLAVNFVSVRQFRSRKFPLLLVWAQIIKTCSFNFTCLLYPIKNVKPTFLGCNSMFKKYQFLSTPSDNRGLVDIFLSDFSFQNLFWSFLIELSMCKPRKP